MFDMNKVGIYIRSILLPVLVGGVVGLIISPYIDYTGLQKPFLAPPSWLFPVVWTILYILMGVSYGILKDNGITDQETDSIYYLQLAVNALWPIIFFVLKWRLFAFIWIVALIILVIYMISRFYKKNSVAGILQIPYLIWIVFASYLNISIYLLNK